MQGNSGLSQNTNVLSISRSHLTKLRLKNCVLQKRKFYNSLENDKESHSLDLSRFSDIDKISKSVDQPNSSSMSSKQKYSNLSMMKSHSSDASCDLRKTMSEPSLRFKPSYRHKMIKTRKQLTNNLTMAGAMVASNCLLNAPMDEKSISKESSSLPDLLQNCQQQTNNLQKTLGCQQLKQKMNLLRYRQHIGQVNRTQSAPQPFVLHNQMSMSQPDPKDFPIWNKGSEDIGILNEDSTVVNNNSRYQFLYQLRKKLIEKSELVSNHEFLRTLSFPTIRNGESFKPNNNSKMTTATREDHSSDESKAVTISTGLAYDLGMLAHHCTCQNDLNHLENPSRLIVIWQHLKNTGLAEKCFHLNGRRAGLNEIQLVHDDVYTILFGSNPAARSRIDPSLLSRVRLCRLACGGVGVDSDTTWHTAGHTSHAARLAVGCVSDLCYRIISGQLYNGFAIVRPPGHLAESGSAMGFCYFNSVAISAKTIQLLKENNGSRKIVILDWDIHHGIGTQSYFYSDKSVLYISLHRHDDGDFFPGTGKSNEVGSGEGAGMNINIPWPKGIPMGDAEYLAAFRAIVLPVINEYEPDLIIVSAGFDGCLGHSNAIGGYLLSPALFGWLTVLLGDYRLVLALEGGYELKSLAESVEACVRALVRSSDRRNNIKTTTKLFPLSNAEKSRIPCSQALECIQNVMLIHAQYWNCLKQNLQHMKLDIPVSQWLNSMEIEEMTTQHAESMEIMDELSTSVKRLHEDFSTIMRRRSFRKQKVFEEEENDGEERRNETKGTSESVLDHTMKEFSELCVDKS